MLLPIMKVKELIEGLESCDQEREVIVCVNGDRPPYSAVVNILVDVQTKAVSLFPEFP